MKREVVRRLLGLMRGQRALMTVSALCRVVNQTLGVVIPAIAAAIAVGVAERTAPGLGEAIAILVALALVKGVFRYLEQFTGHAVAFRLLAAVRSHIFRWLERLEPARLEQERSGDLVARMSGEISRVEPFYAHTIAPVIAAVVVPIITLVGLAFYVGTSPVIVLFVFVVLYVAIVPWIGAGRVGQTGPETRRLAGEAAATVADTVQGAHEIAVLGAAPAVLEEIGRSDRHRGSVGRVLAKDSARRAFVGGLIAGGAVIAVAIVAILADLDLQGLVVSLVLAWTIMGPLRALEEIVPDTEQALAAAQRLFELEDLEPQTRGQADRSPETGDVRFESVTVRAGGETLVESVNLEVEGGSFLGVVGPSGSGKTTLVETLLRHRDASSGRVMVGGNDVGQLSRSALSESVALVPQRPDMFHGTVASNLLLADRDASHGEMRAVLARVRLLEWVEGLEDGLDTPVGERGVGMSGGQLQRLALARAFLRDPAVLILDEATSQLDSATETAVLGEVFSEQGTRTVIVVAHRMETVTSADLIAVMDRGRLVESGTHGSLQAAGGLYAALWERHEDMVAMA